MKRQRRRSNSYVENNNRFLALAIWSVYLSLGKNSHGETTMLRVLTLLLIIAIAGCENSQSTTLGPAPEIRFVQDTENSFHLRWDEPIHDEYRVSQSYPFLAERRIRICAYYIRAGRSPPYRRQAMRLILIGSEYAGKTTLANEITVWLKETTGVYITS